MTLRNRGLQIELCLKTRPQLWGIEGAPDELR